MKALAEIVAFQGQGAQLDEALLIELEKCWYPKYKRSWATNLLKEKRGQGAPRMSFDAGASTKIPRWAQDQKDNYLYGKSKTPPCNVWVALGCKY